MELEKEKSSRKKFVLWGLGIASALTAFRFISPAKRKKETVKMLTQDGKLVEIEKDRLPVKKKKITDTELKSWVIKK